MGAAVHERCNTGERSTTTTTASPWQAEMDGACLRAGPGMMPVCRGKLEREEEESTTLVRGGKQECDGDGEAR